MKRIRSCRINGERNRIVWRKLGREQAYGLADPEMCLIEVDPRQTEREATGTVIHEYLHRALGVDIGTEPRVERMECEIMQLLRRLDVLKFTDNS